ncbi:hypothetical protein CJ468_06491 [Nocardia farcinica]|nr:hypothetical protein CJ468_06491 [Nocardia farcinica]
MLPDIVTVVGWRSCDHLAPVLEGDTIVSRVTVESVESLAGGGGLGHLRSQVHAFPATGGQERDVLDWRFAAVLS